MNVVSCVPLFECRVMSKKLNNFILYGLRQYLSSYLTRKIRCGVDVGFCKLVYYFRVGKLFTVWLQLIDTFLWETLS